MTGSVLKRVKQFLKLHFPKVCISIEWALKRKYFDWNSPKDLNEKILWMSYNTDTSKWSQLADKYRVREYVRSKGLGDILVNIYGKWNDACEIDYDALPGKFVLKCNHDCGSYHIVDKTCKYNKKLINADLNKHLKNKYGIDSGELHYTRITPCVIAEEYLESKESFSSTLVDYKVWCLNGNPAFIWVAYDRKKDELLTNVYDLDWNVHKEWSVFNSHYKDGNGRVPKPKSFDRMMDAASVLAEGFPIVRIDFYDIDGKLYFGEMTFTSARGRMSYFTDDFLKEMGTKVLLPPKNK